MILAAFQTDENELQSVKIIEAPDNSVVGERVVWSGLEREKDPENVLKSDKVKKLLKLLSTDENGDLIFDSKNHCLNSSGSKLTCQLKNAMVS